MKKLLRAALCGAVAFAMVTPALADHQIGGYYRVQGIMQLQTADNQAKDQTPDKIVDQRLRMRWQNNINEYVTVVWFGEVDTVWGEQSKGAIGAGGKANSDGVNVETKHAYLDLKIPETPVSTRLGLQGYGGNFDGIVINNDFTGLRIDTKLDMVGVTAAWFKFDEGTAPAPVLTADPTTGVVSSATAPNTTRRDEDDSDLYTVAVDLMPIKDLKLGLEGYWWNNQPAQTDNYYVGVRGAYKLPMVDLKGWYVYNFGTNESGATDVDISGHAASAKGTFSVAGVNAGLRLIWVAADDDRTDDLSFNGDITGGSFEFYDDNLQIFLADVYYNNAAGGRHAMTDAAYAGYGLFGAVLSGSYNPPMVKNLYTKGGLGYFMAMDDKRNDEATASREGTTLGTELSLIVGYKVASAVDVSLRGAYGMLGDFYDKKAAGNSDPDDLYNVVAMVNVPY